MSKNGLSCSEMCGCENCKNDKKDKEMILDYQSGYDGDKLYIADLGF